MPITQVPDAGLTTTLDQIPAPVNDVSLADERIINLAEPVEPNDAATKGYVDSVASGLTPKAAVVAATTANITLNDEQTVDGIALVDGDRVLVKDQTDATENGIYVVVDDDDWTRADDADEDDEVQTGMHTYVAQGTVNEGFSFILSTADTIELGVTELEFTQFSSSNTYVAGVGLALAGNSFSVVDDTNIQKVRVAKAGSLVGTRREINLIEGSNVTLTVADDVVNNQVDITIAAAAVASSGAVTVSSSAPGSPTANSLWLDTDDGWFYRRNSGNTAWLPIVSGYLNVKWFGAIANDSNDDTAAVQAAIDFAHASGYAPVVVFPPGNYRFYNTVTFYAGSKLMGVGSGNTHAGNVKILWYGPDGDDIWSQSPISEPSNSFQTWFKDLGGSRTVTFTGTAGSAITTGSTTFRHGIHFTNRGDSGTVVDNCGFGYGYGYGIYFAKGGINVQVMRGRSDGMRGGYVYWKPGGNSAPGDSITISGQFTLDNRKFNENATGGGGLYFDTSANATAYISVRDGKLELNDPLETDVGMITFKHDPLQGTQPTVRAHMDSVWVAHATAANSYTSLQCTPHSDMVNLVLTNCQMRNIVGWPMYDASDSLTGAGGHHPLTILGGKSPQLGGSASDWRTINFYTAPNFHIHPYRAGKMASLMGGVNPSSGLDTGTMVWNGEVFQTHSGTIITDYRANATKTVGTLVGVTGSGTAGTGQLTVNTIAGLTLYQQISIAGAGTAGAALNTYIRLIDGNTNIVTLNNNIVTTVAAAAVSFQAPTFIGRTQAVSSTPGDYGIVTTITGATNLTGAHEFMVVTGTNSYSINLPAASTVKGKIYTFKKTGASGTNTIDGNGSETIDGATTTTLTVQYQKLTIMSTGTEWMVIGT